ncbi:hypothetical protein GQ41_0443 [Arenibacter algicola]|jgi:hypothetical protein|uniref:Uncharacterized protein n=2 Tax=Arenibacter TaxID=178469 RepID=A0A221V450_9FLAO|nr:MULTISPECIES: hypothetical protein [Arenibacter]ASO08349.1 hypothetical protein AREALGSMS7_04974 [Arenibacter algicola]MBU2904512.1 hypothetical protein [Arenibacter algicola]MDX1759218.1 hypothetical protein [Arenibacter algicola]RAJ05610.1 hypothetical protein LV92_04318 [Arenibacter echinorum]GBF22070.1 hypothetical protein C21_04263 [Arenibacter sp. NBRC 103722]|tara:strand:- start:1326 stop:1595 length:270 start_codon:yes stop_codon:yes gene_type:complete
MASIKDLKKDINYVLGDIIEAVYLVEASGNKQNSKEGNAIIDNAIEVFDELIAKVNQKSVENRPAHLKSVKAELETKAGSLIEQLNKLG